MDIRAIYNIRDVPDIRKDSLSVSTVQSQYAASPRIRALIDGFSKRLDPAFDIDLLYTKIINIYTAEGWGLDNWGRILGIGREIEAINDDVFGFFGSLLTPFNNGNFYYQGLTNTYSLSDPAYRELLLVKALANISSADAHTLNLLLSRLFQNYGKAYVLEIGIMQIRIVFEFYLSPYQRTIAKTPGLLTRGAGVGLEIFEIDPQNTFGFSGSGLQPFNQGVFVLGRPVNVN